jgi:hypothetical protein
MPDGVNRAAPSVQRRIHQVKKIGGDDGIFLDQIAQLAERDIVLGQRRQHAIQDRRKRRQRTDGP